MRTMIAHENGAMLLEEKGNLLELHHCLTDNDCTLEISLFEINLTNGAGMEDLDFVLTTCCKMDDKNKKKVTDFAERVLAKWQN